jgi:hypothetical protein
VEIELDEFLVEEEGKAVLVQTAFKYLAHGNLPSDEVEVIEYLVWKETAIGLQFDFVVQSFQSKNIELGHELGLEMIPH